MTSREEGADMTDGDRKYWFNSKTGEVEFGMISPSLDRIGPFDTEAEAQRAPEVVEERARVWAEEDAAEQSWETNDEAKGQGTE